MALLASSAHRCSECPSLALTFVDTELKRTLLTRNCASDGTNLPLSSLSLATLRAPMAQELNHSTLRLTQIRLRRPCMIGCNTSDFCTLACSKLVIAAAHAWTPFNSGMACLQTSTRRSSQMLPLSISWLALFLSHP